jgi:ferredoxin
MAEPAPGQQRHVVFVDHGRRELLKSERYRDILKCIRCGACMNACPVYRAAGGLSYGSPYMGPIGAVLSPLIWPDGRYADLPFASSLCGHCTEVCPVGIPLHRMLLDLRADAVTAGEAGSRKERLAWRAWASAFRGARTGRAAAKLGNLGLRFAGKVTFPDIASDDPRSLPAGSASHNPAMLKAAAPAPAPFMVAVDEVLPHELVPLFRVRSEQLGVRVVDSCDPLPGDRRLRAAAAVANTGSLLLVGDDATARRPLLAASRVVIEVDPATIVRHPSDLAGRLGDGNALILTGASRTADIEKIIIRGIHGAEEYVVVLVNPA